MDMSQVTAINSVYLSKNGYPIFELYKSLNKNYDTVSGLAFYMEDENQVKEFNLAKNQRPLNEALNEFAKKYPKTLVEYENINKEIGIMDNSGKLAMDNLIDEKRRLDTFKKGLYGAQYLIEDNQVLIFKDKKNPFYSGIKENQLKDLQYMLIEDYSNGKIKPEFIFTGLAAKRLIDALKPERIELSLDARKAYLLLEEFAQNIKPLGQLKIEVDKKQINTLNLSTDYRKIDIEVIDDKNINVTTYQGSEIVKQIKPMTSFLKEISQDMVEEKVNQFIQKKKM